MAWSADLLTFALIVPIVGSQAESNPVMLRDYLEFGLIGVALLKILLMACGLVALSLLPPTRLRLVGGSILVFGGVLGACGNLLSLGR